MFIGRGGDVVVIGGGKEGSELLGETRLLNAEKCYRFNAPYRRHFYENLISQVSGLVIPRTAPGHISTLLSR